MTDRLPRQSFGPGALRSALLRLSTRIAESTDEDRICEGVAEDLMQSVFGFHGVGLPVVESIAAIRLRACPLMVLKKPPA